MRIRVLLLSNDERYIQRFSSFVQTQFAKQIELSTFMPEQLSESHLESFQPDILLIDEDQINNPIVRESNYETVVFIGKAGVASIGAYKAICKYQTVSDIYKQMMEIYSHNNNIRLKSKRKNLNQKIVTFMSVGGGNGASTIAASFAQFLANNNFTSLYMSFDLFNDIDMYFSGEGNENFTKVITTLLDVANTSPNVKILNAMKRDKRGVYFFSSPKHAVDLSELGPEQFDLLYDVLNVNTVIDEAKEIDWIVVDMPFSFDNIVIQQMERSDYTIFVSDGSFSANRKFDRLYEALDILVKKNEQLSFGKMGILYNRFSSRNSHKIDSRKLFNIGGLGKIENMIPRELVQFVAKKEVFYKIMEMI